ncbi:MAG: nuclear transport factor 2 family protein [Flavobacteriaceae bacterium]
MKKVILMGLAIVLFTACNQQDTRYTQQSPEIDIVKKVIQDYNEKEYAMNDFADTSKTYFNTKTDFLTTDKLVEYHKGNDANYSSRKFLDADQEYEMVVTDEGHTWVNVWLDWQATIKESGKVIDMPVHLTYRFVDGKIVTTYGYWDPTEIVLELQEIERKAAAQSAAEVAEE